MPQVELTRRKHPRRKPLGVLGAILLVVVICIVLFLVLRPVKPKGPTAAQLQQQAETLDNSHKYADEQKLLQDYVASHKRNKDQYWLLIQLGNLALDNRDYTDTLKWYKQAEQVTGKTGQTDAVGVAMADAQLGNKTEAISYYKKAIALTVPGSPDNNVNSYKAAITELGGTP